MVQLLELREPQGDLIAAQESAEGMVGYAVGKVNCGNPQRKVEQQIGRTGCEIPCWSSARPRSGGRPAPHASAVYAARASMSHSRRPSQPHLARGFQPRLILALLRCPLLVVLHGAPAVAGQSLVTYLLLLREGQAGLGLLDL
jgi:hypothetical protein